MRRAGGSTARTITSLLAFGATLVAGVSLAEPAWAADEATAQALFVQARSAMKAGNYEKACPMLEESLRLLPGDGTKFNLGECYEKTGRTASAWAAFRDVAASSKLAGQKEREAAASDRASSLEPTLCRLTVTVAAQEGEGTRVKITRDGADVGDGQWGAEIPVDPGPHTIVASAQGKRTWTTRAVTGTCPGTTKVEVPRLAADILEAPPPPRRDTPPVSSSSSHWRAPVIITSLGLGAVATGVGAYFGARAWGLRNDSNDGPCTGNVCNETGRALREDSRSAGNVSTVAFIAGGALLALGIVLWVTDSKVTP